LVEEEIISVNHMLIPTISLCFIPSSNLYFSSPQTSSGRPLLAIPGDGACGKTCLLIVFSKGMFPEVSCHRDGPVHAAVT
jgi:hypothetical protein